MSYLISQSTSTPFFSGAETSIYSFEHKSFWGNEYNLFEEATQQKNDKQTSVTIISLGFGKRVLLKPMSLRIENVGDDEFIASFPEAGIEMSGDSATEAIQLLKSHLVALFDIYRTESKLGPEPQKQLKILEGYIGEERR